MKKINEIKENIQTNLIKHNLIKLSSDEYSGQYSKLEVMCKNFHISKITYVRLRRWKGCEDCRLDLKMAKVNNIITKNNGKLISGIYVNNHSIFTIKCEYGHIWETSYMNIKRNTWCPECSTGKYEKICRVYFEQLFLFPFPKSKPNFLITDDNKRLELDGYCKELGIAFEHQGQQHFKVIKKFKMNDESLKKIQARDAIKKKLCEENNIKLIIIPELISLLPLSELKTFIINECKKFNINIPNINTDIDLSNINTIELNEIKKIAIAKGGRCLSDVYINSKEKLSFECMYRHPFNASALNIKHGNTWCMKCSGKEKLTIEEMKKLAEKKGGECISTEYKDVSSELTWRCKFGHVWDSKPHNIKYSDCWCPTCWENGYKYK